MIIQSNVESLDIDAANTRVDEINRKVKGCQARC